MKRYILILVALIAGMAVHAEDLQKKALADYDNKNYAASIDDYQQLEKQSGVSAEYYFNLGNAYYRSGKKGKASRLHFCDGLYQRGRDARRRPQRRRLLHPQAL